MEPRSRILLIDLDDPRRLTRVRMLTNKGYEVHLREDWVEADDLDRESSFDLVLLALHDRDLDEAAAYTNRLTRRMPTLPILLLTDSGVYLPQGTLSKSVDAGNPVELMKTVAAMLAGSTHIQELEAAADD